MGTMNDSTSPRLRQRRARVTLFGTLALAIVVACGGRAASPDLGGEVPEDPVQSTPEVSDDEVSDDEVSDDEVPSEAPASLPPQFDVLELRKLFSSTEHDASYGCEFKAEITINLALGRVSHVACKGDPSGVYNSSLTVTDKLAPEKRDAIRDAYRLVRSSDADTCRSGAEIFTLDVEVGRARERRKLLFADDDHAGCPVSGIQSTGYAAGLPDLYAVLAPLLAN
jgi:hypothetical protein